MPSDRTLEQISVNQVDEQVAGELTLPHLIISIVVTGALVLSCLCLGNARLRKRINRLRYIPRPIMPFLRSQDMSKKQRERVLHQLIRSNELDVRPRLVPECTLLDCYNHKGCGITEPNKITHFKSAIASSYWYLEGAAQSSGGPKMKRRSNMTVREYVFFLSKHFSDLNLELCTSYVEIYERARFSKEEFSREEFNQFTEQFETLLDILYRKGKYEAEEPISS